MKWYREWDFFHLKNGDNINDGKREIEEDNDSIFFFFNNTFNFI